jgi:opacity protein-like surface antigen
MRALDSLQGSNIMQKFLFSLATTLLLMLSQALYADAVYIGGGLGYETLQFRDDIDGFPNPQQARLTGDGVVGTIVGGYMFCLSGGEIPVWLSLEGNVEFASTKVAPDSLVKMGVGGGAGMKFGVDFKGVGKPYGLVGWQATHFEANNATIGQVKKTLNGIRFGGGFEINTTEMLSMRAEFAYTAYDRWLNTKPQTAQFMLNFVYYLPGSSFADKAAVRASYI